MRAKIFAEENRRWWTLGALCFALFMIMLDNTVVNVALPAIQADLGISVSELEWTVAAYALTFASLLLTGGKLGDLLGRRLIFTIGLAVFTLSSLACGLSSSAPELISARAVQGIGAALMMPATLSIISATFHCSRARDGDRDLGRRLGDGARDRPLARRGDHRAHLLELDLLRERPDRRAGGDRRDLRRARVEGHLARAAARPSRPRHVGDRPVRARLRADRGPQLRLDVGAHPGAVRGRSGRAGRVRAAGAAPAGAAARPLALQERHLRRSEHRRDPRHARDVRDLRLLPDLHADLPRLVADPGRRGAAALDADDRHLRADRRASSPTASAHAG